jgi:hypothetical protein
MHWKCFKEELMKYTIDIYKEHWDFENLKIEKSLLVWSAKGKTERTFIFLRHELHELIGRKLGDGFRIKLNTNSEVLSINIFLIEDLEDEIDIEFIKDFIKNIDEDSFEEEDIVEKNEYAKKREFLLGNLFPDQVSNNEERIYISHHLIEDSDLKEISNLLKEEDIEANLVSINVDIYERGASGLELQLIVEVANMIAATHAIVTIGAYYKKKYSIGESKSTKLLNQDALLKKISEEYYINRNDLTITSIGKDEGLTHVTVSSRYKEFQVVYDSEMSIKKFNVTNYQKTSI